MIWRFTYLFLALMLTSATTAQAQLSCEYTLQLFDSFGDGWNGSSLTVTVNGTPSTYTLDNITDDGLFNQFAITLMDGDEVVLEYSPGTFENEVSYFLYDADGILLFTDGDGPGVPTTGEVFSFSAICPSCPAPSSGTVSIDDVRAFYADISFLPADLDGGTLIEFGELGFTPGTGQFVSTNDFEARLEPLNEKTFYEFYLAATCSNGDTSAQVGPFSFETLWANDVGITGFTGLESGCDLGIATITAYIQNFGALPQSLIPFNFSVNGMDGGVPMPQDGLFTGVLGKDSIAEVTFETTYDFSQPGDYTILVWTELTNDSVPSNDTLAFTITSVPTIVEFPYFENFESFSGGWSVGDESANNSWAYGSPAGADINTAASGVNAWVTNLSGQYNNNEESFLESPCMDFSSLTEDPRLYFSMYFNTEPCCDEAWVESSIDGGETWNKVGLSGTGQNWYNDGGNQWWDGDGGFEGWQTAYNVLSGTAGESDVRVRFVFSTDGSVTREGIGIDDILITIPFETDLASTGLSNGGNSECGSEEDAVQLTISNNGLVEQTGFDVAYSIDGAAPVIENVGNLVVFPNESITYTFQTPFNSVSFEPIEIKAWTIFADDFAINDTTTFIFAPLFIAPPFTEDFEDGMVPANWTTDEISPIYGPDSHNNESTIISDNNYSGDQTFLLESPTIGPLDGAYTLTFDYRYVEWSPGTEATITTPDDVLRVEVSNDCGLTFDTLYTLTGDMHTPTTEFTKDTVQLFDYAGETIIIRFTNTWGASDYWFDMDNINIEQCANFGLSADVTGVTSIGSADGAVTVTAAMGENLSYLWSTGDTTPTITNLAAGTYTVTVTDESGCSNILEVEVDVMVGTTTLDHLQSLNLYPNPTNGESILALEFEETVDVKIRVLSTMGQEIYNFQQNNIREGQFPVSLSRNPAGVYLIQVWANDSVYTTKLVKTAR